MTNNFSGILTIEKGAIMPGNDARKNATGKGRPVRGQKRRSYLDQARQLFARFGYAATSFEQIADAAGVSRAVLVKSFRDKAAFLQAIGDDWLEALFPPDTPHDAQARDVLALLQAITERFLDSVARDHQTARIVLTGLAEQVDEEESAILAGILGAIVDRLLPILQEGQQAGVIRRGNDAREMAGDWLRFMLGSALLPPTEPKEGELQLSMIETLLHGVMKTDV
jgi:AcrR family transcriptional regulator